MLTRQTFRLVIFSLGAGALMIKGMVDPALAAPLRPSTAKAAAAALREAAKTEAAVFLELLRSKTATGPLIHDSAAATPSPRDDDFRRTLLYCGSGMTAVAGVNEVMDWRRREAAPYLGMTCAAARGAIATAPVVRKPRTINTIADRPSFDLFGPNTSPDRNGGCLAPC
jgi:hypothetical protein